MRIEDVDTIRSKPEFETTILDDLDWLGFRWEPPLRRQSEHFDEYQEVLNRLTERDLLYPCSCSRRDILQQAPDEGWDGPVYPGTCRNRSMADRQPGDALRLNLGKAKSAISTELHFVEVGPLHQGTHAIGFDALEEFVGDPVLLRRVSGEPAYHIACIWDDALLCVTHVVRGDDLFRQTWIHVVLQVLLGLPTPIYHHHDLVRDTSGKRLAKISSSKSLRSLRTEGWTLSDVKNQLGL